MRYPGSQLLADWRRGQPGEFPNRPRMKLRAPSRAPLPLRFRDRLEKRPDDEQDESLYLNMRLIVKIKVTTSREMRCAIRRTQWPPAERDQIGHPIRTNIAGHSP